MDVDETRVADPVSGPLPDDDSISASVQRLIATGKDLVSAEVAWAKLKGRGIAAVVQRGILFGIVAVVCLIVGLALLLVAAIVALAPITGLLAATLIVSAIAFLFMAIFGFIAKRTFESLGGKDKP